MWSSMNDFFHLASCFEVFHVVPRIGTSFLFIPLYGDAPFYVPIYQLVDVGFFPLFGITNSAARRVLYRFLCFHCHLSGTYLGVELLNPVLTLGFTFCSPSFLKDILKNHVWMHLWSEY